MNNPRDSHTATLLTTGKVLVTGSGAVENSAELYDPASGTWTPTGAPTAVRFQPTATLLTNGKVLVAGGFNAASGYLASAELYDPITGTWTRTGTMSTARQPGTATLLPNGKVLVLGGFNGSSLSSAELYDPTTGLWITSGTMNFARRSPSATLLRNGRELYDVGLGFDASWQPQIDTFTSPLSLGGSLVLTGSRFRGISGASVGGPQDSPTDYPVIQLRSVESERTVFLLSTNWSANTVASVPVNGFLPGYALVTVFVNGIPSTGNVLNVRVPVPTTVTLTDPRAVSNGLFQFAFTNSPGALFGVLATTNLAMPLTNWTELDGVTEISPGQFQFTGLQATNSPQRFYLVRSP